MLLRETLGIASDGTTKAYRYADVEAFLTRKAATFSIDPRRPSDSVRHCFIAIDPSGGGASAFAIASVIVLHTGSVQVCCAHPADGPSMARTHTAAFISGYHIISPTTRRTSCIAF